MLYIYSNSILSTEHKKKLTSLILTTTLKRKDKPNHSAMVYHVTSAAQRWTGIHSPPVRLQCKVQYPLCRESSGCCLLLFIILHIVILYLPNCKRTQKKKLSLGVNECLHYFRLFLFVSLSASVNTDVCVQCFFS